MRTAALAALSLAAVAAVASDWEGPSTFSANEVLTPAERKGPDHTVDDTVKVETFYYAFEMKTEFGDLQPIGHDLLRKRIHEIEALKALNDVSKTGVFLKAAGRSLEDMGEGIVSVARDPEGTARGLGSGIKRFGINLGRKTKRVYEDATDKDAGDEKSTGETAENVANAAFGVNKAARTWARKIQVDPYSRNPILQGALLEIGKVDAAGGIATRVAVPIPMVVSATSTVGGLVWDQDPEALRKTNEAGLRALGVPEEVAAAFFRNDAFTLTDHTRFVSALGAVKAKGLADYVDTARHAEAPREALFFVESAEMLQRLHREGPVETVLSDSRALVASSGGRAVAVLPLDYLAWTESVSQSASDIAERSRQELGAKGLQMQITGRASGRARAELQALGWAVVEGAASGSPREQ